MTTTLSLILSHVTVLVSGVSLGITITYFGLFKAEEKGIITIHVYEGFIHQFRKVYFFLTTFFKRKKPLQ